MGNFTKRLMSRRKLKENGQDGAGSSSAAQRGLGWQGYADAKPSESIQPHDLPGLAVAVVFPYKPGTGLLSVPVQQYKSYKKRAKGTRAKELAAWLRSEKEEGLVLSGFIFAHAQVDAARIGLESIEELPDTRVEPHYEGFRLLFGSDRIDFAQAVALEYYFLTITLASLRAASKLPRDKPRKVFVAMDRFPGASTDGAIPGAPVPPTDGTKFLEFVRARSSYGRHVTADNASENLEARLGTLDWWKRKDASSWEKGKTHPHFVLPDWLAAAALAREFPTEFVASFSKEADGTRAAEGLADLYNAFKEFDLWSMDAETLRHIHAADKVWEVPDEAREFILSRAEPNSGSSPPA